MNLLMLYSSFLLSSPFLTVDQPLLFPRFPLDPFLSPITLSLSISKGQMLPAVTVALHWYSALNLAKRQAAVSPPSNRATIWQSTHAKRDSEKKAWRIKGTVKYERETVRKKQTERPILLSASWGLYTIRTCPQEIKDCAFVWLLKEQKMKQ